MKKMYLLMTGTLLIMLSFTASATIIENWQFDDGAGIKAGDAVNSAGTADWGSNAIGSSNILNSSGQAVYTDDGEDYFRGASGFNGGNVISNGIVYLRIDFTSWTIGESSSAKTFCFGFADSDGTQELLRLSKGNGQTTAAVTINQNNENYRSVLPGLDLSSSNSVSVIFGINMTSNTLSAWTDAGLTGTYTPQLSDIALIAGFGDIAQLRFEAFNLESGDTISTDMLVIGDNLSEIQTLQEEPPGPAGPGAFQISSLDVSDAGSGTVIATVDLSSTNESDIAFVLEYTSDLVSSNWQPVATNILQAPGGSFVHTNTSADPAGFYRILAE